MADFFYRSGLNEFGPLTGGQLKRLVDSGRVAPGDEVRKGRGGKWVPAATVRGLFERPAGQPELAINEMDVLTELPPASLTETWPVHFDGADRETAREPVVQPSRAPPQVSAVEAVPAGAAPASEQFSLLSWARVVAAGCYLSAIPGLLLGIGSFLRSENVMQEVFGAVLLLIALVGVSGGCAIQLLLAAHLQTK